jgi:hypothetical protein
MEAIDGVPLPAATRRLARDYAGDVFGSPRFAPWLDFHSKRRGAFHEGWIPDDFFELVVLPRANGPLRSIGYRKTLSKRMFRSDAIPDLAYIIGGVVYNAAWEPIPPVGLAEALAGHERLVIKDDGGRRGLAVRVVERAGLDLLELVQRHPNAVVQRYIRDHPRLRVFSDANGFRLRITTCAVPGGGVEARGCFVAVPRQGMSSTRSGENVTFGDDSVSGAVAPALVPAEP